MLDLPRFHLFDPPSPMHPLPGLSATLGDRCAIWIKREDLLPVGLGGNKLRNLEFLVGAAIADGADTLITSGRRWSNHCRLTAAAGARAGLRVHLVLSGDRAPSGAGSGPGVLLDEMLGATIHDCGSPDRAVREAAVLRVADDVRRAGHRPYVIGVGGSGAVGAYGQLLAAEEAGRQALDAGITIDVIVVASATGGTQAGLIVGGDRMPTPPTIHGVLVAREEGDLRPEIAAIVGQLRSALGIVGDDRIVLDATQLGPGYGRRTAAATEAAELLARSDGILADPIYTAKALAALIGAVRSGALDGQTVLFWHGGGTPGLFEPLAAG